MPLVYERELRPFLEKNDDEIIQYANSLIESNNARNSQKAAELSHLLRKAERHQLAVYISKKMFEKEDSVENLNMYFSAVIDESDINSIRELASFTEEYVLTRTLSYQKHLFATWLKGANRIMDDAMFDSVYDRVPISEKRENSFIISQYYVFLNRQARYSEVKDHYEKLQNNVKEMHFVKKYYQNAMSRMGYPTTSSSIDTNIKNTENANETKRTVFIVYGNRPSSLDMVKFVLQKEGVTYIDLATQNQGGTILEKFEGHASCSSFAIILLSPEDKVIVKKQDKDVFVFHPRQNVILEWGYFMAKIGKKNVAVLVDEGETSIGDDFILPSDILGTEYITIKANWFEKLIDRLKQSGIING